MQTDRLYDRLFDSCATDNQLSRVHITLENQLTPSEAVGLAAHIRATYADGPVMQRINWLRIERDRRRQGTAAPGQVRTAPRYLRALHAVQWVERITRQLDIAGGPPSPIRRVWSRRGATLFRTGDGPGRTLVVVFSGNLRGVMMPTPVFLQFMRDRPLDVLKLEAPRGVGYVNGVRGFSHDFPSTVAWLAGGVRDDGFARVATFGTSGGALAALLAASGLDADACVVAGASDFTGEELCAQLGVANVSEALARTPQTCAVTLLYGQESGRDAAAAAEIERALPQARVVAVPDAGHACLYELVDRGQMEDLVATRLLAETGPLGS
jgi:hypothetical protein